MGNRPIGIYDSGVGGLTVFKEIKKILPNENTIYLGDTKNFPYGNKSKEEIIELAIENTKTLIQKDIKILVIACGTVTSQAIDVLKERFDIPIVGIIEPTVKYIKEQEYKEVGVIATEGTIRSGAWEKKLKENIRNIKVINKACPMLATIAEEGKAKSDEGRQIIKEYMKPFKKNKTNKIILGCTHYPIYEELIKEELGYPVQLINTGTMVATTVKDILEKENMLNKEEKTLEEIYLSKEEEEFSKIAENIMNVKIKEKIF